MDSLTKDLLAGKYQATREDIWKVHDYESMANRAYQLGKQDRQLDLGIKVEANSIIGNQVIPSEQVPAKEQGESNFNYFRRLAQRRLAESSSGKLKQ